MGRRSCGPHWHHGRSQSFVATVRHRGSALDGGPLSLRRLRRKLVSRQQRSARRRASGGCVRGARASHQPRHRVRADHRHVEVHRWRQDVHRVSRRAGRRRLPEDLDQPDDARRDDRNVRPGCHRHAQWRLVVEQLVQPADSGLLSRHHGQRVSVSRLQRPAGERIGVHLEPRRRRANHVSRVASGGCGGIRLRRARPARSRHRLRRQGVAIRSPHRSGAEHHAEAAVHGRGDAVEL